MRDESEASGRIPTAQPQVQRLAAGMSDGDDEPRGVELGVDRDTRGAVAYTFPSAGERRHE